MAAITVTTTATLLYREGDASAAAPAQVVLSNDGGASVFIGPDSSVTAANGVNLKTAGTLGVELTAGREIWAITATGTNEVRVVAL